ncbi:conserved hypothetical protein [Helicobacter cinaedi PAGU611]|uniref:DUF721 domain-containing protein n=2 Tax=Helicobacter cinaedi CCUG 18818 = ATCC BAA-847 TaxID=537971 RepID=A0AAI8MML0_9HELI|nr:conserved hypothetical protein [Helicobacter cinaedi PAGU611]BAM32394.1 conserved hypothetical protein [Helicobacter cinaedi CCUG 18818 = ATCC BAA-847]
MKAEIRTKTMYHLLSHIKREFPLLHQKLEAQSEITRFKNAFLTPLEREQILFIVPKNNQLLFAFKHKALCLEFNHYKHKFIIESLKQYKERFPSLASIQKIHAYVPSHILSPKPPQKSVQIYREHAKGEFINHAKNPQIYEKFEALRVGIKRQWEAQNAKA